MKITVRFSTLAVLLAMLVVLPAGAADWQWSAPMGNSRAFLWIPPDCKRVRAVVVGQNNMIEQGILEHDHFRKEMSRLGVAEIFIAPPFDTWQNATNNDTANAQFDAMLKSFAGGSGCSELEFAPIIPLGHSAMASYPWNFAAWNQSRTLAILSVHGDTPQTDLVGNGQPNVDWGWRNIDGIPGLMAMAEYEWLEARLTPALKFRNEHPKTPLAMLAEPGNGHFNYCDNLIKFLAMFIRKAAEQRLPTDMPLDKPPVLKPVDPTKGWLVERWHLNQPRTFKPVPWSKYTGDPNEAFWCFDREMAMATQDFFADQPGKQPQLLGLVQDGKTVPQTETHQQVNLRFIPLDDGVTFRLSATFLDSVESGSKNLSRWTYLPAGSPLGHASGGGPIAISRISGPVAKINGDTFRVQFDRVCSTTDKRNFDIWLLASHSGDSKYKSIMQQALLKIPRFTDGAEQHINFPEIHNQKVGTKSLKLNAASDSGRKVYYYVREGPAEIEGDTLRFTKIPPRTKFPVKVTIVAWQHGLPGKVRTAAPVLQEFNLTK